MSPSLSTPGMRTSPTISHFSSAAVRSMGIRTPSSTVMSSSSQQAIRAQRFPATGLPPTTSEKSRSMTPLICAGIEYQ